MFIGVFLQLILLGTGLGMVLQQCSWYSDVAPLRLRHAPTHTLFHAHQRRAMALAADGTVERQRASAAIAATAPSSPSASAVRSSSLIRAASLPSFFDPVTERTLVLYVFSNNDALYIDNLRFFIDAAVRANDPADYVFVIQQDEQSDKRIPLSSLPPL